MSETTRTHESTRPNTIALVTDSTCDLPGETHRTLRTVVVPLHVTVNNTDYLDRVDLDSATFFRLFRESGQVARSSQPSAGEFQDVYERLLETHDAVVSVHIAGKVSGTVQSASTAARKVDPQRVRVVDARHVSVGLGLVVKAAGEAILAGQTLDEVVATAEKATRDTRVYSAVESLDAAVRGGLLSAGVARVLESIAFKPLIVFDEDGGVHTGGARLGFSRALRATVDRVAKFADGGPVDLAVSHADGPAAAEYVHRRLAQHFSDTTIPIVEVGAVITTHVGLGTIAIAVRRLQPGA